MGKYNIKTIDNNKSVVIGDNAKVTNNFSASKIEAIDCYQKIIRILYNNELSNIEINSSLLEIKTDLEKIKLGQEITYTDLKDEFDLLNLPKSSPNLLKTYSSKLGEMVISGMVSIAVSEPLIKLMQIHFA